MSEFENLPKHSNAASVFVDKNILEGRRDNIALFYGDETMAYQDAEGYFRRCGRSDDMMKVSGMWVSPVEIENILASHEAVLERDVPGNLDEDKPVKPKAFVVFKDGYKPYEELKEEPQTFVLDRAAPYKHHRWMEFIESLPRTVTGKVQRFKFEMVRDFDWILRLE